MKILSAFLGEANDVLNTNIAGMNVHVSQIVLYESLGYSSR